MKRCDYEVKMDNLKYRIKQFLKPLLLKFMLILPYDRLPNFYQNINLDFNNQKQKRLLISYVTSGLEFNMESKISHTLTSESVQIIHVFIKMGYCVDVMDCCDTVNLCRLKKQRYDVVFGFGEPFYEACKLNPNSIKIIYLTELEPRFSMKQEMERSQYFYERHKKRVPIMRSGVYFKSKYLEAADFGILMGNEYTKNVFDGFNKNIFLLKPSGLENKNYLFASRNITKTKRKFIWFGSRGAVHKGLDLLIDVFKSINDCDLYICGLHNDDKKLFLDIDKFPNIIDMGFVNVESENFIKLVNETSFVILPSCSEGMATSVLTCMNHSLIPIVTKETGIDVFDFGIIIEDYHVDEIEKIVRKAKGISDFEIQIMHEKVYKYSKNVFNLQRFTVDFQSIMETIISSR